MILLRVQGQVQCAVRKLLAKYPGEVRQLLVLGTAALTWPFPSIKGVLVVLAGWAAPVNDGGAAWLVSACTNFVRWRPSIGWLSLVPHCLVPADRNHHYHRPQPGWSHGLSQRL